MSSAETPQIFFESVWFFHPSRAHRDSHRAFLVFDFAAAYAPSDHFLWIAGLLPVLLLMAGCDFPTEAPSFETNAEPSAPLVAEKTFAFLEGGRKHTR